MTSELTIDQILIAHIGKVLLLFAKVAIAIELGYRIFQAFPGAQASARRLLFLLLIATSVAIIGIPVGVSFEYLRAVFEPRVVTGTIWLMNGLALLIVWYRVPAHPF